MGHKDFIQYVSIYNEYVLFIDIFASRKSYKTVKESKDNSKLPIVSNSLILLIIYLIVMGKKFKKRKEFKG